MQIFSNQTWKNLEDCACGKKIVLFGVGSFSRVFLERYKELRLIAVVDNDIRKQGLKVKDVIGETKIQEVDDMTVFAPDVLLEYGDANEMIVVVASVHDHEIARQLEGLGIYNVFSIPKMEENSRERKNNDLLRLQYIEKFCDLPIENKKVCIMMGNYGGHGYYITKALLEMTRDVEIVWIVRSPRFDVPDRVRIVFDGDWKNYYKELETAKIWIYDNLVPGFIRKRDEQIYIQVKHWSSITLKKFYMDDIKYALEDKMRSNSEKNAEIMDYIFSGSQFDEESCNRGFLFRGDYVRIGSPRSDALFDGNNRKKVCEKYNVASDTKLALVSPTYRDIAVPDYIVDKVCMDLDFEQLKCSLEARFGGEWKILLRLHPSIAMEASKLTLPEYVIDTSIYENSQELVAASEIMITDYSSIMFEPAFVNKPVFLYAPDRETYINEERELLLDYDELPFSIARSNEELVNEIKEFSVDMYEKNVKAFFAKYGVCEDGHASERAARFIMKLINI